MGRQEAGVEGRYSAPDQGRYNSTDAGYDPSHPARLSTDDGASEATRDADAGNGNGAWRLNRIWREMNTALI